MFSATDEFDSSICVVRDSCFGSKPTTTAIAHIVGAGKRTAGYRLCCDQWELAETASHRNETLRQFRSSTERNYGQDSMLKLHIFRLSTIRDRKSRQ